MPGIVVAVGTMSFERFRGALGKLEHLPAHRSNAVSIAPGVAIGWAGLPERVESDSWRDEVGREVHVWRYGHTFRDGVRPAPVGAAEILRTYLDEGIETCFDYEGSFVIVVADMRSNRVYIAPDRLCSQPLYYTRRGDDIVVGPEVKVLAATLDVAPRLSTEGLVGFLAAGYNIGSQTIFTDTERLELGKMIEISLSSPRRLLVRRFWKHDFEASHELANRHDAEDALFEAIKHGHRVLLSDEPKFQVLLSGGVDSRGILGTCNAIGMLPAKAVTWGLSSDVPRSDAFISKALADRFGVPWDFIVTRTEGFIDNCEDWSYVSELSNDNFGWYAEGFGTLSYMQQMGCSCSLIGDEAWGWRGFVHDEHQACEKVLAPAVPAALLALIRASEREGASESYSANLRRAMSDCTATDWNDRKDYLYLHSRIARFIFALGYNRGLAVEQRRPFFTRAVLDVVRRLPPELRVHKNVYRTMLDRHLPETRRVPYATVDSLPDWAYDLRTREALRQCFLVLLTDPVLESGALAQLLDMNRFSAVRDAYFAQAPTPVSRKASAIQLLSQHIRETMWRSRGYKHIDRWMIRRSSAAEGYANIAPVDLLRRVAVVVLLERQLGRFQTIAPSFARSTDTHQRHSAKALFP